MKNIIFCLILCTIALIQCTVKNQPNFNLENKNIDTIKNSVNTSKSLLSEYSSWIGHYRIGDRILYLNIDKNQNLIGHYNDGIDANIQINNSDKTVIIDEKYASYSNDTLFLELIGGSSESYMACIKLDYQNVDYSVFNNDNISLNESLLKEKDFIENKNIERYSSYSSYKFNLNFNSPKVDNNRDWEPSNFVYNGYQRKYFENSEKVYCQRKIIKGIVIEETYFHPNGNIYTINEIIAGKRNGYTKFVDLNNHVILQGCLKMNNIVGTWDNPIFGNFNVNDRELNKNFPGVLNKIKVLIKFYDLAINERNFYYNM